MNDEFLHQLRQPPPPAFAARLRARLESRATVRRFRGRQITLYALMACLLGGTALALVSPSVRQVAGAKLREMLPQSVVTLLDSGDQPRAQRRNGAMLHERRMEAALQQSLRNAGQHAAVPVTNTAVAVGGQRNSLVRSQTVAPLPTAIAAPSFSFVVKGDGAVATASVLSVALAPFQRSAPSVRVALRVSNNGQGFGRFCAGTSDIALATRGILPIEVEACRQAGIRFIELPVAYEALAVLVNPDNTWAQTITPAALGNLFGPESQGAITSWSEIDVKWPTVAIVPFAIQPGQGLQDSFNELIPGIGQGSGRNDIEYAKDEAVLITKLRGNLNGLTYLPFAYYDAYFSKSGRLRPLAIVNSKGQAVMPSRQSIADGSYEPLSRPLLIYVKVTQPKNRLVEAFVHTFLAAAGRLLEKSFYLTLAPDDYELALQILDAGYTGTAFRSDSSELPTASEILLRHLPAKQRESERARRGL